jgi:hypothetical protein
LSVDRAGEGQLTMVDQLDVRLQLHRNGYAPLPLVGKACYLKQWETKTDTSADEIRRWPSSATNTGANTKYMPTADLDITNEEAVHAAEKLIREAFGGQGRILVRIGRPPKRAIPFRTDQPFKKIKVLFESDEKVEFLCDGQQVAVAGTHPDIKKPYRWLGGELWETPRDELPYIHEAGARSLIDEIVEMLCRGYGYRRKTSKPAATNASVMGKPTAGGSFIREALVGGGRSWREGGPMKMAPDWVAPKALYLLAARVTSCPQHKRRVIAGLKELVEARQGRNEMLFNKAVFFRQELVREGVVSEAAAEALLLVAARLNLYTRKDGIGEAARTVRSGLGLEAT